MNDEIRIASTYLASVLVSPTDGTAAADALFAALTARFHNHFDLARPVKGSGFRCIHITNGVPEALIRDVLLGARLPLRPSALVAADELALFVDPGSVAVKIGARPELTLFARRADAAAPPLSSSLRTASLPSEPVSRSASSSESSSAASSPPDSPPDSPRAASPPSSPLRDRVALNPHAAAFSFAAVNSERAMPVNANA